VKLYLIIWSKPLDIWAAPNILFIHGTYKPIIYNNNYTGISSTLSGRCVPTSGHVIQDLMFISITPFVSLPIIFTDRNAIQLTFLIVRPPNPITLFAMNAKTAWLYIQLHKRMHSTSTDYLQMTKCIYCKSLFLSPNISISHNAINWEKCCTKWLTSSYLSLVPSPQLVYKLMYYFTTCFGSLGPSLVKIFALTLYFADIFLHIGQSL
jgi:hypothetical protein